TGCDRSQAAVAWSDALRLGEGLVDIGDDVVDMLDAHRNAHQVFRNASPRQLFRAELAVRGRSRVAGQRLGVADIDQPQDHVQRVDELAACFHTALDAEADNTRGLALVDA